jgi:RND family efflux transporter MFP subunit
MNHPVKTCAALALLTLAGCSNEPEQAPEIVRPVLSVVVQPHTVQLQGFAGSIEPRFSAALSFRLLGRIVERDVEVGDIVKQGVTIAALDPVSLELAVQAANADLSSAQAQLANAAASEERQRSLLASKNVSQADYDSALQGRDAAKANVERAQASLSKAEEQLGYARLFSDFDGVVTATGAEVGQTVSPGQMVVTVARSDIREAVFDVPDQMAQQMAPGETFQVSLQSQPTIYADGTIREIAPQADSSTRTRRVRLTLINPPNAFRLGSTIAATRVTGITPSIELPLSALLEEGGNSAVWVVDPKSLTVSMQDIKVASKGGGNFIVTSGLDAGARVVTAGVHSLKPGQTVKIPEGTAL